MKSPCVARRAIAMLAKAPLPGIAKTRLVPPLTPGEAAALARAFAEDLSTRLGALARALDAEFFIYHTPDDAADDFRPMAGSIALRPQGAGELGTRMHAIVTALCGEGFTRVVLIGSDMPTLPDACVAAAFDALDAGSQVAIARADDGGYVLLGVDAPHAALFADIAWSTATVYATTLTRARAVGLRVHELAGWYDIDTAADLARLQRECASGARAIAPRTCRVLSAFGVDQRRPTGRQC